MKTKIKFPLITPVLLALLLTINHQLSTALAQGTAFTYQGQLQNNGSLASGKYNLTFTLFATNSGGTAVAGPVTNSAVSVTNGLFTVTIDFGSTVWNSQTNWLQIGVETNNTTSFTTLAPRQQVTPTPFAIAAESLNGTLPASQLTSIGNTNGGGGNFFLGASGNVATSGSDNTANGLQALNNNTTGGYNVANGAAALDSNTSGSQNTADGVGALGFNTSGSDNVALGYLAGFGITTGSNNIDIGNQGFSTDTNIIRIGSAQTQTFIAGVINGNGGGLTNLSAAQLVSIGVGTANFFVGPSGNATTIGSDNTALGVHALENDTFGLNNTALGASTLNHNTTGSANTAIGESALVSNITGDSDTAIGWGVLYSNTNGNNNTAIGESALAGNTSGSNNIAVGLEAGYNITTGSSNIDIGNLGGVGDNNLIRIGTTQTATYLVGTVYANGVALTSDRNAKENFTSINTRAVLDKVASLPITEWNYKTDKNAEHIGPMAQDFKAAFGLDGPDDKHISVVDEGGVALAAVQGLNQKLETENAELKQENNLLAKRLDDLEMEVRSLAHKN